MNGSMDCGIPPPATQQARSRSAGMISRIVYGLHQCRQQCSAPAWQQDNILTEYGRVMTRKGEPTRRVDSWRRHDGTKSAPGSRYRTRPSARCCSRTRQLSKAWKPLLRNVLGMQEIKWTVKTMTLYLKSLRSQLLLDRKVPIPPHILIFGESRGGGSAKRGKSWTGI